MNVNITNINAIAAFDIFCVFFLINFVGDMTQGFKMMKDFFVLNKGPP